MRFFLAVLLLLNANVFALSSTQDRDRFASDIFQFAIPAISLGIAAYKKDGQGVIQLAKTVTFNQVVTEVLKVSLNNVAVGGTRLGERPDGGSKNFPSGHTSTSFASAWQIKKRYGIKCAALPLVMATFTGYNRVNEKRHTPSAVVAGVLVGIASAELFSKPFGSTKTSVMVGYNGMRGLNLTLSMKY